MKNNRLAIIFSVVLITIFGCSTDDKFSGSPLENQKIVTLTGSIAVLGPTVNGELFALNGQGVEFTASLPEGKVFADTVVVEITTFRPDGGRVRDYFDIMPGQSSVTDKIDATGSLLYEGDFEVFMSNIRLQTVEPGIHYLMNSNRVTMKGGDSSVPASESDRLNIFFSWENPSPANKLIVNVDKPSPSADVNADYGGGSSIKHIIRVEDNGPGRTENKSQSFRPGDYVFSLSPDDQPSLVENKRYRILVVFPNGLVKVFRGTLENWSITSSRVEVLRVNKTGIDNNAVYTVTTP